MRRKKSKTNRRGSDKQEQRYMKEREIKKHARDPRGPLVFFSEGRLKGAALSQRAEGLTNYRGRFISASLSHFLCRQRPSMADQKRPDAMVCDGA